MKNRLKIAWHKTVQAKLIFFTMLATTVILAGFASYNIGKTSGSMKEELSRLGQVTAQRLSRHLVSPMWDLDDGQVAESITAEMLEHRVQGIVVRDTDGQKVFKAKQRDAGWNVADSDGTVSGQDLSVHKSEITNGKESIGFVEVYMTPVFMDQELTAAWVQAIGVAIGVDLIIFLTLWFVAKRVLVNPIIELANSAERMSKGQLNVSFEVESEDEIGHMADAFRRMQMSLRLAIRRLKQASARAAA